VLGTVYFSLVPSPPAADVMINDKLLHAGIYCLLASWFAGIYLPARYGAIAIGLLLLGAALELLQLAGGARMGEWLDLLANAAGIAAGLILARMGLAGWCGWLERLVPGPRRV
jgi:hypothetical protein